MVTKHNPREGSFQQIGQPTRRITLEDLNDPVTVKYIRKRMNKTQAKMAEIMGLSNAAKWRRWEVMGMGHATATASRHLLLKFDLFLLAEKHMLF